MDPLVVPLTELDRSSLALAGGKAANLGELLRGGFPVPDGVCVTTAAYRRAVAAAGIAPRLDALLRDLDVEDTERLAEVGAAVRALFYRAAVPAEVARAVVQAARTLEAHAAPSDTGLAVRSSATAEDLPEASFAGQQETYLNVVGETALLEALRRCWASLWTDRAIAYRQRNGIPHASVALAVVVQRMVQAQAAGVLFTVNPVSGKRTEMTLEASLGLGEAVVSGLVTPDTYVVDKATLRILRREIGAKTVQVVGQAGGGTAKLTVDDAVRGRQALPDDAIVALADLGKRIEEHFGAPQDVEWAWAEGRPRVLQSRPITSLYPVPPPGAAGELRVYVSLNSVQGMLEPFTPMGASLFSTMARAVWANSENGQAFFVVELGGRLYADMTSLLQSSFGKKWATEVLPQAEPVIGRILERLMDDSRLQRPHRATRWAIPRLLLRHWRTVLPIAARVARSIAFPTRARRYPEKVIVPRLAAVRREMQGPVAAGAEIVVLQRFAQEGLRETFLPRLLPLVMAGMLCYRAAEALVHKNNLDPRLLLTARQGLPHNKTTTMDLDLWALARAVRADAVARDVLAALQSSILAVRYREDALPLALQEGMAKFLTRYGHRAVREIDVGMPRWREDPTYLFGVLQSYLRMADQEAAPDRHFARQMAAGDRAVEELVAQIRTRPGGWWTARALGFLLRRYRALGGLRETPKFYLMWLFEAIRGMLLASGRRLAQAGWLDRPEDVFFLRTDELGAQGQARAGLRPLVQERRRAYDRELRRHQVPRVITSEGEGFHGEVRSLAQDTLSGTSASPGVARGRARVIRDPVGARLEPGEILVAPSTDPAWTPLFLAAGGLVMEAGGMMSHGAIVAREYGIPAVVGVAGATAHIADGEEIEVDGNEGVVRIARAG